MGDEPENHDGAPPVESDHDVVTEETGADLVPAAAIRSTRTSRAWIRLLPALIVLVVILVFVFQNPKMLKSVCSRSQERFLFRLRYWAR